MHLGVGDSLGGVSRFLGSHVTIFATQKTNLWTVHSLSTSFPHAPLLTSHSALQTNPVQAVPKSGSGPVCMETSTIDVDQASISESGATFEKGGVAG